MVNKENAVGIDGIPFFCINKQMVYSLISLNSSLSA